ncbi:lactate utilization protein C, partial [Streptomyces sp. PKU-MA01144]|nr:lactate utilization protein C [Streptomyces sp. PKU-MA01144]
MGAYARPGEAGVSGRETVLGRVRRALADVPREERPED